MPIPSGINHISVGTRHEGTHRPRRHVLDSGAIPPRERSGQRAVGGVHENAGPLGEIADNMILTRNTLATNAESRRHLAERGAAGRPAAGRGDSDLAAADRYWRYPRTGARCAASGLGLLCGFPSRATTA